MNDVPRLLVVGPSWVGDMVIAHSLYQILHARDPSAAIDVLAPRWSLPLLERMPEVRRGIDLPAAHGELALGKRRRLGKSLHEARYSQAIVLPRSLKAALVPFFAGIPRRTGFLGEYRFGLINDVRPFDAQVLDQTVKRIVALGAIDAASPLPPIREPRLMPDATNRDALLRKHGLDRGGPLVALMPGAEYGPAKQWPAGRFRSLAAKLAQADYRVCVLGSATEESLGSEVAGDSASVRNLCGRTSLPDAIDLLSAAAVAISNDSGLMHVAAAVGCHVIGIYGSSSPRFTPPLTSRRTILHLGLSCSPCFERTCPLGHSDCLTGIGTDEVLAAALEQLEPQV